MHAKHNNDKAKSWAEEEEKEGEIATTMSTTTWAHAEQSADKKL